MRIHRGSLFWGIFFLLLGGIPLADRQGLIDVASFTDVGRLWPLAIIAIGVAVLVSRTQLALIGTLLAAVVLGGLAGGTIAAGSGFVFNAGDCSGESRADMQHVSRNGTLNAGSAVDLRFDCGTLALTAGSGDGWSLAADYRGDPPVVNATAGRLSIRTPTDGGRRHEWSVAVPRERLGTIDLQHNAGTARLDVSGTSLSRFKVDANAGDIVVIAENAAISLLDVQLNAGRARLTLGGATEGSLQVNAGSIEVCTPANAELRITIREQLTFGTNLEQRGLTRTGNLWQRAGSGGPVIRLDVAGNVASFNLDPTGGCK
jgi:hypothetical protein